MLPTNKLSFLVINKVLFTQPLEVSTLAIDVVMMVSSFSTRLLKKSQGYKGQCGKEFDQAFTKTMWRNEEEATNKCKKNKRKRGIVNAYNELKRDEQFSESDEDSENKEKTNVYQV